MGRPKAGIVLPDGKTMIEHVYAAMSAVCQKVVLAGRIDEVAPALKHVPHVDDRIPDIGPLGGIEALLASNLDSEYLIAPCDLYLVVPELFRLLIDPAVSSPAVLTQQDEKHMEPSIARYDKQAYPILKDMIDRRQLSMRELALRSGASFVEVPRELVFSLRNANTPDDLHQPTSGSG
jgi:molybdopterin-guanine dinucleotide biosynthesis protein A